MGRMIFDLTDEDRALLEATRIRLGLRSHAETIRALIRHAAAGEVPPGFEYVPVRPAETLPDVRAKAPIPKPGRMTMDDVRPKFVPRLKPEKGKR